MKYTYDEYRIMLESAWSAFENTLKVWGMSEEQMEDFFNILGVKDGYKAVDDAISEVIEWEDE